VRWGNSPQIKASLLASGHSMASVIASQFTEATGNLYPSALIEIGLVLFGLTIILNGAARLLILATGDKGSK
jgi:phosphate transport system permease protein